MTSTWQHQYLNCSSKNRKQTYIPIHINTMVLIHKNIWFEWYVILKIMSDDIYSYNIYRYIQYGL